jgi:Rrf2 family protein
VHLSAKADYALRAMVSLAELFRGESSEPISIRCLAERNDIPKRFLEQIMIDLRTQGWVKSVAGRDGGFILGMLPEKITMAQIVRHFDGIIAPIDCVSTTHYKPCSQQPKCKFRRILMEIRNFTAEKLDQATLDRIVSGQSAKPSQPFQEFVGGEGI